jgi:hypothetical protein
MMNGTQRLSTAIIARGVHTAWSIAQTGDFNGDGNSDILWRNTDGNNEIWFMNGSQISNAPGLGSVSATFTNQALNAD